MRFVRYQSSNDPLPRLGWLLEDRRGDRRLPVHRIPPPGSRSSAKRCALAGARPAGEDHRRRAQLPGSRPRTKRRDPRSPLALPQTAIFRYRTRRYHPSPTTIPTGSSRGRAGGGDRQNLGAGSSQTTPWPISWDTRSATMSPPATCSAAMGSGHAAKASTPSARWDPGSRRSSTRQTL